MYQSHSVHLVYLSYFASLGVSITLYSYSVFSTLSSLLCIYHTCSLRLHHNCMIYSCCFAFRLKTVAFIVNMCFITAYCICMIMKYLRLLALSVAFCPCLRACLRAHLCYFVCLSKSSALSKMGRLWALTFTPVTYDFRVLSKRGNCRHPIFDRP